MGYQQAPRPPNPTETLKEGPSLPLRPVFCKTGLIHPQQVEDCLVRQTHPSLKDMLARCPTCGNQGNFQAPQWARPVPLLTWSLNASSVTFFRLMSTLKYAPNTPVSRALAATCNGHEAEPAGRDGAGSGASPCPLLSPEHSLNWEDSNLTGHSSRKASTQPSGARSHWTEAWPSPRWVPGPCSIQCSEAHPQLSTQQSTPC